MGIIALSTLKAFWEVNPEYQDARESTLAWSRHTLHADCRSPAEVKLLRTGVTCSESGHAFMASVDYAGVGAS